MSVISNTTVLSNFAAIAQWLERIIATGFHSPVADLSVLVKPQS